MKFDEGIAQKIKNTVLLADSGAQVILYGSRARGTARADSDWDVLILLSRPSVSIKDEQYFRHQLYDLELETGQSFSTFVYSVSDWNSRMSVTPLYQNVKLDGIVL
ncbi:MAG: nucleotidyltransferase domain-containing protein [Bacteroidetes bacterium]|nr:nucleotidyltransferase domain-containing protein [Bacteroidota bacterium]MBU1717493.1 nucleotidyltransferase domain-containing protein [Bacteroidota bacterium]